MIQAIRGARIFQAAAAALALALTVFATSSVAQTVAPAAAAAAGSVKFGVTGYVVGQGAGSATVGVHRIGGSKGPMSVSYATKGGSASPGTNFTATSGTFNWTDGDVTTKMISIPISNATPFSGTKAFTVALSTPSSGAAMGSPSTASVTILGDAGAATAASLEMSASSYTVAQTADTLRITVKRTAGSSGAVSVAYATTNGTAVAGTNFAAANGTLHWAAGDVTPKTFLVDISTAAPFAGSKTFGITLSNASTGAVLGSPKSATVNITGGATATVGNVAFSAASYAVSQASNAVTVTVNRSGGASGAVSAAYSTANGTAVAGKKLTQKTGTVQWASGDATSKTISVPVSDAAAFAGTKSFSIGLADATGGASVSTPNSAAVTITGSAASTPPPTGANPSAPTNLVMTGQTTNSISLSWTAAAPGGSPIASYKIYRNGAAYASTTGTSYTDTGATNANSPLPGNGDPDPTLKIANTVYSYAVSAVDTAGNEGPQQSNATFWVYHNGVFNWLGDFSYPGGSININYADASGDPESGPFDIEVSYTQIHAGFQPYAGKTTTVWDMEGGSFGYFSIDVKPTVASDKWELFIISRLPPGDVYPWSNVNLADYGPAPVVGKWATYKIPLSVLTIGSTHFTGSIAGNTLTVSSVSSGVGMDAGGYVTGPGVPAGTYIMAFSKAGGKAGTYTVAGPGINGSTSVPSAGMVEQRTGVYKFGLPDQGSSSNNHYYLDNIKFSVN